MKKVLIIKDYADCERKQKERSQACYLISYDWKKKFFFFSYNITAHVNALAFRKKSEKKSLLIIILYNVKKNKTIKYL